MADTNDDAGKVHVHRVTNEKLSIRMEAPITINSWHRVGVTLGLLPGGTEISVGAGFDGGIVVNASHERIHTETKP